MAGFKDNIVPQKGFTKSIFWGKYEDLNKVQVPDLDMIQAFQLKQIEMFEKLSLEQMKPHSKLNALFASGNVNKLSKEYDKTETKTIDLAITNLVSALNGTYAGKKRKDEGAQYNYDLLQMQLGKVKSAIEMINTMLKSNKQGQLIDEKFLNNVEEAMAACGMADLGATSLNAWFSKLNSFKGDIVEEIGVKWLDSLGIPNIQTLNTGSLNYQGSLAKGRHTGQIIQDLMILSIDKVDILDTPITYRTVKDKNQTVTLKEFFQILEKANFEGGHQIIIEDDAYDLLESLSALNIQAKAGLNQIPWNQNKTTEVSIGEFSTNDGLAISAKHTINLLHQLDCENIPDKDVWVNDISRDYKLIADYGLGTVAIKVLHLNGVQGNQYLLTPQGFTSYSSRLKYLMEKKKSRLTFRSDINIGANAGDVMGMPRRVAMTNYR